jgi:hypothetical protein
MDGSQSLSFDLFDLFRLSAALAKALHVDAFRLIEH